MAMSAEHRSKFVALQFTERHVDRRLNKRPTGLNGHLSITDTDFLSEGFILAYQQTYHRTNKNQQWQGKTAFITS